MFAIALRIAAIRLNEIKISPNSRRPGPSFRLIQAASYGPGSGADLGNKIDKKRPPEMSPIVACSCGSVTMVDHLRQFRSYDPDAGEFDADHLTNSRPVVYKFGRSARDRVPDHGVPLFLSDPDGEPDPLEFMAPLRRSRIASVTSRILVVVVAASAIAMLFAWFSSDSTRNVIVNAKASIASVLPPQPAAAQPESEPLTSGAVQAKEAAAAPTPVQAPAPEASQVAASAPSAPGPVVVASASPTRDDIPTTNQTALQTRAPATALPAAAQPVAAPPPARRIDPEEMATLMKRATDLLAAGDIPSARLLLERAAEAQEASAALMLAQTYDPDALGTSDVRNITPDPATARKWYQRAAQLGSSQAQRRLAQLQN